MKRRHTPRYGNWISSRILLLCIAFAVIFASAFTLLYLLTAEFLTLKIILALTTGFFLFGLAYFLYARRLFSPHGGDIQNSVLELLLSYLKWNGEGAILDIGCGNGALAVKIAKRFPNASVTALDSWGLEWNYDRAQCEQNAMLEGVSRQIEFVQGSADALPFADDTFDLVVSNMTFHEVKTVKNKLDPVKEALRVLKPGGAFVLQDLFMLRRCFGTPEELVAAVQALGVKSVTFEVTRNAPFIPKSLRLPFMLGAMGVLRGEK